MTELENFSGWEGQKMSFMVDEKVYNFFQELSGDMNPLHTNAEFAKRKGFPQKVMYGNILNCFVSTLIGMCLPTPHIMIAAQDIKFKNPVYLNDRLDATISVSEIFAIADSVELKFTFTNESNLKVAVGKVLVKMLNDKTV